MIDLSWIMKPSGSVSSPPGDARRRLRMNMGKQPAYVIGDVHGRLDLLKEMENAIAAASSSRKEDPWLILVGDCVDRGPSSAQVLDHIIGRQKLNDRYVHLCGNHELMMQLAATKRDHLERWFSHGGEETLMSYGRPPVALRSPESLSSLVPAHHLEHLRSLPIVFETERYYICHAGVRPGVSLDAQQEDDLLWWLDDGQAQYLQFSKVIVHGHEIVSSVRVEERRIAIDTGAYATGVLSAVCLRSDREPEVLTVGALRHQQTTRVRTAL